jgi:hypothetical protein
MIETVVVVVLVWFVLEAVIESIEIRRKSRRK